MPLHLAASIPQDPAFYAVHILVVCAVERTSVIQQTQLRIYNPRTCTETEQRSSNRFLNNSFASTFMMQFLKEQHTSVTVHRTTGRIIRTKIEKSISSLLGSLEPKNLQSHEAKRRFSNPRSLINSDS